MSGNQIHDTGLAGDELVLAGLLAGFNHFCSRGVKQGNATYNDVVKLCKTCRNVK